MQVSIEDKIEAFLEKKYRYSKSFHTKRSYNTSLKQFQAFLQTKYNLDINQSIFQFEAKTLDPIVVLDEFYTHLSKQPLKNSKRGYSNASIVTKITVAKEFLNNQNLHIYNEDLKQRFKMPKKEYVFEEGLTKEIISRLLRNSSSKLQTIILICVSSGMRIGELL